VNAARRRANRAARKRIRARARARAWVLAFYGNRDPQLAPWQLVTYLAGPDPRDERANRNRMFHTAPRRAGKRRGAEIAFALYDELRKDKP